MEEPQVKRQRIEEKETTVLIANSMPVETAALGLWRAHQGNKNSLHLPYIATEPTPEAQEEGAQKLISLLQDFPAGYTLCFLGTYWNHYLPILLKRFPSSRFLVGHGEILEEDLKTRISDERLVWVFYGGTQNDPGRQVFTGPASWVTHLLSLIGITEKQESLIHSLDCYHHAAPGLEEAAEIREGFLVLNEKEKKQISELQRWEDVFRNESYTQGGQLRSLGSESLSRISTFLARQAWNTRVIQLGEEYGSYKMAIGSTQIYVGEYHKILRKKHPEAQITMVESYNWTQENQCLSLRSQAPEVNIQKFCKAFGGGASNRGVGGAKVNLPFQSVCPILGKMCL